MLIKRLVLIFFSLCLFSQCDGTYEEELKYASGDVIQVGALYSVKEEYKSGETYSTKGDTLRVKYKDSEWHEWDIINAGFTQEWSLGWPWGTNEDFNEWINDPNRWFPIKHGDPLPIAPPVNDKHPPTVFYVRADLNGKKGVFLDIRIFR
jgi:hypothetical protein